MTDNIIRLAKALEQLKSCSSEAKTVKVTVGFDGCIDSIFRPIKSLGPDGKETYFNTIDEFGKHLSSRAGLSCAVDMREISVRKGGNMPNISAAMTALGAQVQAVGNMGWPRPDSIFDGIAHSLYTVGAVGICNALQFDDGKVMLSNMHSADDIDYVHVHKCLGDELMQSLFAQNDAVALVNWAEMQHATDIWSGIVRNYLSTSESEIKKYLLIDLTDCAKKNAGEILAVCEAVKEAAEHCKIIWSMNSNEARQLSCALNCFAENEEETARNLFGALEASVVCIHRIGDCIISCEDGTETISGFAVRKPKISVGAGDTFNAGLLWALCKELFPYDAALFANAVTSLFVKEGKLPLINEIMDFINQQLP